MHARASELYGGGRIRRYVTANEGGGRGWDREGEFEKWANSRGEFFEVAGGQKEATPKGGKSRPQGGKNQTAQGAHSSGWRARALMLFLWLVRTAFVFPAAKSQSRMVQSWLPVTTCSAHDNMLKMTGRNVLT